MFVAASASNGPPPNPFHPSVTTIGYFPLFTLGPVFPGTLTLDWNVTFDGDRNTHGSFDGITLWDLESGSPVLLYTSQGLGPISVPLNVGVPFAISLKVSARALSGVGFTGGSEDVAARVSVAPVPEPAAFLLVLSGLLAVGLYSMTRANRKAR
jgi:hypothetical protein